MSTSRCPNSFFHNHKIAIACAASTLVVDFVNHAWSFTRSSNADLSWRVFYALVNPMINAGKWGVLGSVTDALEKLAKEISNMPEDSFLKENKFAILTAVASLIQFYTNNSWVFSSNEPTIDLAFRVFYGAIEPMISAGKWALVGHALDLLSTKFKASDIVPAVNESSNLISNRVSV